MSWKWVLWCGGGLVCLVVLVTVIGALLPRGHVAIVRVRLRAAPHAVFAKVRDVASWRDWNPAITRIERQDDLGGDPVWTVDAGHGPIASRITEASDAGSAPPYRLVTVICDDELPFAGSWTWQVDADGAGAAVTLTEDGEVKNPLFRFLSYTVFGTTGTAEGYLRALGEGGFGETVTPEVVRTR